MRAHPRRTRAEALLPCAAVRAQALELREELRDVRVAQLRAVVLEGTWRIPMRSFLKRFRGTGVLRMFFRCFSSAYVGCFSCAVELYSVSVGHLIGVTGVLGVS